MNRGDALLVETLMDELKAVFPKETKYYGIANHPDLQEKKLSFVEWTQQPGRSDTPNIFRRRIQNAVYSIGTFIYVFMNAPSFFPSFLLPKSQQQSLLNIKHADIVISCPGGLLVEETTSVLVSLLQLWSAKKFDKKLIIAPQTIGPIKNPLIRKICGYVLRKADIVVVREDFSRKFVVNELNVDPAKVIRGVDMALSHKKSDPAAGEKVIKELGFTEGEKFLGASVIQWVFPNSSNPGEAQRIYEGKLAQIYKLVHQEMGMRVLIFNQVSSDINAARRVRDLAGDFVIVDEADRDVSVMRSMIGSSHLFLGSRLHSCIFSILEHVPALALAYNYKTDGIMNDIGQSHRVWKIEDFEINEVFKCLKYDMNNRTSRSKEIEEGLKLIDSTAFKRVLLMEHLQK